MLLSRVVGVESADLLPNHSTDNETRRSEHRLTRKIRLGTSTQQSPSSPTPQDVRDPKIVISQRLRPRTRQYLAAGG